MASTALEVCHQDVISICSARRVNKFCRGCAHSRHRHGPACAPNFRPTLHFEGARPYGWLTFSEIRRWSSKMCTVQAGQGRSGWTALKRDAGLIVAEPGPEEEYFSRRFGDLLHVDDARQLNVMAAVASGGQRLQQDPLRARFACRCLPTRSTSSS